MVKVILLDESSIFVLGNTTAHLNCRRILEVCKRGEEGILQNNFSSLVLTGNSLNNTSNLTV